MSYKKGKPKRKINKPSFLNEKYEVKNEKNNISLINKETGKFIRYLTKNDYKKWNKWRAQQKLIKNT